MPRGNPIPDSVKDRIYTAFTLNESVDDIAESMDLHPGTVRRIVREERKRHEREREVMSRAGKIVKKDGNGGKLMALSPDGFEFIHVTPDGRSHKKKVDGHISRVAEQQYDKWCEELDGECEFMRRIERKVDAVVESADEQPAVENDENDVAQVEDAPLSFEEFTSLAESVGEIKLDADAPVKQPFVDTTIADTELPEPKLGHWFNKNGSFAVVCTSKPVYAIWAKGDEPRFYGLYRTMDRAIKEIDRLNEVAQFLGKDGAFEIEEVSWRG